MFCARLMRPALLVLLLAAAAALPGHLHGQTATVMPEPKMQFFTSAGTVCAGCKLYAFVAGTATPLDTCADSSLNATGCVTANAHPVVLDSAGRATIFLLPRSYKFRLDTAADVTIWTVDTVYATGLVTRVQTDVAVTGTQNDFVLAPYEAHVLRWAGAGPVTFTGWSNGASGRTVIFQNQTSNSTATFSHENTGSLAVSRFSLPNALSVTLGPVSSGWFWYDATSARWRLLAIHALSAVMTITSTGTQNDFVPGGGLSGQDTFILCNNQTPLTITGLANGTQGQRVTFRAINTQVDFVHASVSSATANRFQNHATSGNTSLGLNGTATYQYNGAWYLVAHDQGAWITPTFSATNYAGNGGMTWTVAAGDVTTQAYWLTSRTLHIAALVATGTVGGTASTQLFIGNGAWGGFTAAKRMGTIIRKVDNGVTGTGFLFVSAAGTQLICGNNLDANVNWTLSTDNTGVDFVIAVEVQ